MLIGQTPPPGFGPGTNGLTDRRSTTELQGNDLKNKSPSVLGGTRTPDQQIRSLWLYPSELPRHETIIPF
jgi:hypothetical protein